MKTLLRARKSNKYIEAQLFDVKSQKVLSGVKAKDPVKVGTDIGKIALSHKVVEVSFDRGTHKYHGQIKKLADAARNAGLKF